MSHTITTIVNTSLLFGFLLLTPLNGFCDNAKKTKSTISQVKENEKIKFHQQKAHAHMGELEERMFRLSKLIQKAQPDDAARLLMGVRKAREHLIADRMKEATDLLDQLKLGKAIQHEQKIITHLEELKKILLTADISLELKLEQLRKLMKTRETLSRLIKKEKKQLANTQKLSKNKTSGKNMGALQSSEKRNQKTTENIEQSMRKFGNPSSGICKSLSSASQSMGKASQNLGASKPKPASKKQQEAITQLSNANANMKKFEEKLRKEVKRLVRQRVTDNIQDMITQQKRVREKTAKLVPRVQLQHRQAILATRRLAVSENRIIDLCEKSIELCNLTKFSFVLPVALKVIQEQMTAVATQLSAADANDDLVNDQYQIEKDLQSLLDAIKEESRASASQSKKPCKSCQGKGNPNKLLAELKILRWMQQALQVRTNKIDQLIAQKKLNGKEKQKSLKSLIIRQTEIDDITNRLHSMTCRHCLNK